MDYYESESLRAIVSRVQRRHPGVVQGAAVGADGVPGSVCGLLVRGAHVAWVGVERQRVPDDPRPRLLSRWCGRDGGMHASFSISEAASALVRLVAEYVGRPEDSSYHRHVHALRGAVLSLLDDAEYAGAPLEATQAALAQVCKALHEAAEDNRRR